MSGQYDFIKSVKNTTSGASGAAPRSSRSAASGGSSRVDSGKDSKARPSKGGAAKSVGTITVGDKTPQQLHKMVTEAYKALGLPVPRVFNIKFLQGVNRPAKPVSDDDFWSRTEASHVSKLRSGEKTKLGQIALALRRKDTETNGVQNLAHATYLLAHGVSIDVIVPTKREIEEARKAGEPMPVSIIGLAIWTPDGKSRGCTLDEADQHIAEQLRSGELVRAVNQKTRKEWQFHGIPYTTQHINHVCKLVGCLHPAEEAKARQQAESDAVTEFLKQEQTVQVRTGKVNNGREQVMETSCVGEELEKALTQGYYGKKLFGSFTWKALGVEFQSKLGPALVCRGIASAKKHWAGRYGGSWRTATEKHRGKLSTYAKDPLTRWTYHVASERWVPDTCHDAYDKAYTAEKAAAKAAAKAERARAREDIERLADDFELPYPLAKAAYNDRALPTDEAIAKALHELHGISPEDALEVVDRVLDQDRPIPVAEALKLVMGSAPADEPPSESESDTDSEPEEAPAPEPTPPPAAAAAPEKPDDSVEAALAAIAEQERALAEKKAKLRSKAADQGESTAEKKRKRTRRGGKKNGKGKKAPAEKKPTVPKPAAKQGGKSKSPGKSPAAQPPAPVEQPKKPPQAVWVRKPEHAAADAALAESGATFGEARKTPVTLVAQKKRRRPRKKSHQPAKKGGGGSEKQTPKQSKPEEKGSTPAEVPEPQPEEMGADNAVTVGGWGTESEDDDDDVPDWVARFVRPEPATRSTKAVHFAVSRSDAKSLEC